MHRIEVWLQRTGVLFLVFVAGLGSARSIEAQAGGATAAGTAGAGMAGATAAEKSWIGRSDQYTQMLLDVQLKHSPESGSAQGLAKYDGLITDGTRADEIAQRKELEAVLAQLKAVETKEKDRDVREDLEILQRAFSLQFREDDYQLDHKVAFLDASAAVYGGLRVLLDDHVATERRNMALVRLLKYAGAEEGYKPLTEVLKQRMEEQMAKPGVEYPSSGELEAQLGRDKSYMDAISKLFQKYKLAGWQSAYAKLTENVADYDTWVRSTVMPKASKGGTPSPEEYALALESYEVTLPPAELAAQAHAAFTEIQAEMTPVAAELAKEHGWSSPDYRDVLGELKKRQITGDLLLPFYQTRLQAVDDIIVAKGLVTLPATKVSMRMASEQETAQSAPPHMVPPPFLHNTGQKGEFVLPLNLPVDEAAASPNAGGAGASGAKERYDDFTYDAAAWPETALEVRPGHELQFDAMLDHGMSMARVLYAINSTNLEGWGTYAEWMMQPYEPADGQLATLQMRLLDAARGFLDPELASGKTTPQQAYDMLVKDVGLSPAYAKEEVQRYTQRLPAQATTYFFAYTTMQQLRKDAETALGKRFDAKRFNDFVLAQGMLPLDLLRKAVMEEFVPGQKR
jgi:hypothetical protein